MFNQVERFYQYFPQAFFISYYPWFDVFYHILNDLAQLINSQSVNSLHSHSLINDFFFFQENDVEKFLTSLYNHKLISVDGEELIVVNSTHQYSRPDSRRLPSIMSDVSLWTSIIFSRK